jgi:murein DD-endopeptidase MepM/ murein hydrolase activator NlpD
MKKESNKKKNWIKKLRDKYRLVIVNENTFEDKYNIRLSRLNVFIVLGTLVLILTMLIFVMIAFTPLKEYIPGFANIRLNQKVIRLQNKLDSLTYYTQSNEKYIQDIKKIISGENIIDTISPRKETNNTPKNYDSIQYRTTEKDSLLRMEYEKENAYNLFFENEKELRFNKNLSGGIHFFPPMKGLIIKKFDPKERHYAVDIVARKEAPVKAIYDGTVLFSSWTLPTGYVMVIQHPFNYISVYKHNSVLLKQQGEHIKAGEPIAIVGTSGELSTGPHLHFELWYKGVPINPEEYITF